LIIERIKENYLSQRCAIDLTGLGHRYQPPLHPIYDTKEWRNHSEALKDYNPAEVPFEIGGTPEVADLEAFDKHVKPESRDLASRRRPLTEV